MRHIDREIAGQTVREGNPNGVNDLRKAIQTDADLVEMLVGVAGSARVGAIICPVGVCPIWPDQAKHLLRRLRVMWT